MFCASLSGSERVHVLPDDCPILVKGVLHPSIELYTRWFDVCEGACFFCEKGKKTLVEEVGNVKFEKPLRACSECKRLQPTVVTCDLCKKKVSTTCFFDKTTEEVVLADYHFCSDQCRLTPFRVMFETDGVQYPVVASSSIYDAVCACVGSDIDRTKYDININGVCVNACLDKPICSYSSLPIISISVPIVRIKNIRIGGKLPQPDQSSFVKKVVVVEEEKVVEEEEEEEEVAVEEEEMNPIKFTKPKMLAWFKSKHVDEKDALILFGSLTEGANRISKRPLNDGTAMFSIAIILKRHEEALLRKAGFRSSYISPFMAMPKDKKKHYCFALLHAGESRTVADSEFSTIDNVVGYKINDKIELDRRPKNFYETVVAIQKKYCVIPINNEEEEDDDFRFEAAQAILDIVSPLPPDTVNRKRTDREEKVKEDNDKYKKSRVKQSKDAIDFLIELGYDQEDPRSLVMHFKRGTKKGVPNKNWTPFNTPYVASQCLMICVSLDIRNALSGMSETVKFSPEIYTQKECIMILNCKFANLKALAITRLKPYLNDSASFVKEVMDIIGLSHKEEAPFPTIDFPIKKSPLKKRYAASNGNSGNSLDGSYDYHNFDSSVILFNATEIPNSPNRQDTALSPLILF